MTEDPRPPGPLDRLLKLFGDVRPGEGATALLMLANLFLLLVGYYVLKTVREPLILAEGSAELKSYASAGQAVALMGFIPLYSWFSSRVDRVRLIFGLILFFVVCLEAFFVAVAAGAPFTGVVFYIWVGIFSLATIAQFWSYANDVYLREQGERLFPIIAIGATAGGPVGAQVAGWLFAAGVAPHTMFHFTAAVLLVHLFLYWLADRRLSARPGRAAEAAPPLPGPGGFALVLRNPYIRLIALLLILLNIVNTTGEYVVSRSVVEAADAAGLAGPAAGRFIGGFYASYNFWVTVGTLILQAFAVSRIVKYLGVAGVVLALPLVSLGAYSLIAAGVGFAMLRWAKTAENATDYSVMNTAKQLLWLPTRRDEKYKAKQTVDTFFVRAGDVLSAGVVFVGTTWFSLGIRGFAATNLVVIVFWVAVAVLLLRRYRDLAAGRE